MVPASRLLARGVAAAGVAVLLGAAGSAFAQQRPPESPVDRAPYAFSHPFGKKSFRAQSLDSPGQQHGGDTGHLPPVARNVQLVSKHEPMLQGPIQPEQIADLAVYKGFAYLNSWGQPECDKGGTYVVDIRNPAAPRDVTFIPALQWNYHGEGAHVATLDTAAFTGDVLAVNNETCAPGDAEVTRGGGFDLYDVSDPANPVTLVQGFGDFGSEALGNEGLEKGPGDDDRANEAHSIFIWDAGDKAYAVLVDNDEFTDVDIFDITNPRSPEPVREYDLAFETPAWTETGNQDQAFLHDMIVKNVNGTNVMLLSYWDAGYIQMNADDPANLVYMSDSDFATSDPLTGFDPPEGNAHQAEFSYDNRFILTGEEDFAPFRVVEITIDNVGVREAGNVAGGAPPEALPDGDLNGPVAYGGYGCDASATIPTPAEAGMPAKGAGEEWIIALQRGPAFDPDEDYDGDGNTNNDPEDACFPGDKAANAAAKGWDAVLLFNRHQSTGDPAADSAFCGSGGYPPDLEMVTVCTRHGAFHELFNDTPTFGVPYDDSDGGTPDEGPGIGDVAPNKVFAEGEFDSWGYMSMYSTAATPPDEDGKSVMPFVDAHAITEAMNPDYAIGFGDLSVHEQAADPTEPISYSSYYAGGMRVFSFADGRILEQGAFIDEGGNNFWGVEQFTTPEGDRLFAGSDRDLGLYIFRYTGPLAPQKPVCTDTTVMVPYRGTADVPLPCTDANGNPLDRSIVNGPSNGTLSGEADSGKVSYSNTRGKVGASDSLTFRAFDGAANSNVATVTIVVVPGEGGACSNPFIGDDSDDRIVGSQFGDSLRGAGGRDSIQGLEGDDCLFGQADRDQLEGGIGDDRLTGGGAKDRLFGGSGDDVLAGKRGRDHVLGASGNDKLGGGNRADFLDGGSNDDRVIGGRGDDKLRGGPGRDRVLGGGGDDHIEGGDARNRLSGGGGDDKVFAVNDRVDRIACGSGDDEVLAEDVDVVADDCESVSRPQ